MQDLCGKHGKLTILDKFAQVQERTFGGFRNCSDQGYNSIDNGTLEFKAPFFTQKVGQEANQNTVLRRVGEAEFLQTTDNRDLVLIGNFGEESRDLLEQSFNRVFTSSLEERGDGKSSNIAGRVSNQCFQIFVALGNHTRKCVGHASKNTNGRKTNGRFWRTQKELQDRNCRTQVLSFGRWQIAQGLGCFKNNKFRLVTQTSFQELISGLDDRGR
mmetsp:Transcript_5365/g.11369  ORF Transcript_5365/g.11369 Transcript_5365/m.11369 type:complete len:215 (+) Transcript_5365:1512-2156(+)